MDIEDLQTFVEVADAGGVSAAARRLGISKSIVSRRLFRLEAELGVQLMTRTTRGAALTEAGVAFRVHAARLSTEIDAAKETILPNGDLRGHLRVAVPLTFGPTSHQALMQGTESGQFLDGDKSVTVHPQGRFKADNAAALATAAVAGLGIARLPDCVTDEFVATGALVPIMKRYPVPSAAGYVIRPPGQHASRKVRLLTNLLIECLQEDPRLAGFERRSAICAIA